MSIVRKREKIRRINETENAFVTIHTILGTKRLNTTPKRHTRPHTLVSQLTKLIRIEFIMLFTNAQLIFISGSESRFFVILVGTGAILTTYVGEGVDDAFFAVVVGSRR
jgi:hypothetical protein